MKKRSKRYKEILKVAVKDKKIAALNYKNFFKLIYKNCSKDLYLIRKYNKFKEVINI